MYRLRHGIIPAALLLAVGCTPVTVNINSIPTRTPSAKLERVFIEFGTSPSGAGAMMEELKQDLIKRFAERGIQAKGWVRNHLNLNEDSKVQSEITAFQPGSVLRIRLEDASTSGGNWSGGGWVGGSVQGGGHYSAGSYTPEVTHIAFDLRLVDPIRGDELWKARLTCDGPVEKLASPMGSKTMEALGVDGFLPHTTSAK